VNSPRPSQASAGSTSYLSNAPEKRRADCDPEERPDDVQIDLEKRESGGDTDGRDDIGEPDLVVNPGGEFGGHLLGIK